jgi:hypothetical protein
MAVRYTAPTRVSRCGTLSRAAAARRPRAPGADERRALRRRDGIRRIGGHLRRRRAVAATADPPCPAAPDATRAVCTNREVGGHRIERPLADVARDVHVGMTAAWRLRHPSFSVGRCPRVRGGRRTADRRFHVETSEPRFCWFTMAHVGRLFSNAPISSRRERSRGPEVLPHVGSRCLTWGPRGAALKTAVGPVTRGSNPFSSAGCRPGNRGRRAS